MVELNAIQNAAYVDLCAGNFDATIATSEQVLARGSSEGPRLLSLSHVCIARALLAQGHIDEAERHARVALEQAPTDVVRMYTHATLADVLRACGKLDEARARSAESMQRLDHLPAVTVGDLFAVVVHAEVLERAADRGGARAAISRAQAMFEARRAFLQHGEALARFDRWSPEAVRLRQARAAIETA